MIDRLPQQGGFLDVLGESGWGLLLDAGLAFETATAAASGDVRGAALAAAERLRKARPTASPGARAAALELVSEGARFARKLGVDGVAARVPLKDMAPGLYVLRVEATARVGDRDTTAQELVFRVLPMPAAQQ